MKKIMGIDLSLNGTAIYILSVDKNNIISPNNFYVFSPIKSLYKKFQKNVIYQDKDLKGVERLAFIDKKISNILHHIKIDNIAMEDYSFASIGKQFSIGELGGVIKLLIYLYNIPLTIYKPTEIKKFITGKGHAPKSTILLHVYKKFGMDFSMYDSSADDIADSYVIAQMLYNDLYLKEEIKSNEKR